MKITYTQNPLATIVELDNHDRQVLLLKLEIEDLVDKIVSAEYDLGKGDTAGAARELDYSSWMDGEKAKAREARFVELLKHYEDELRAKHVGDCVCVACTCSKCHAEEMFALGTIKGLGKHQGNKIASAFIANPDFTCEQVIQHMRLNPPQTQDRQSQHIEPWTREHYEAIAWLESYMTAKLDGLKG